MPLRICAIAAMDQSRAIGMSGSIPWHYPEDMKHFSSLTTGHAVLMGRKTYQSLPAEFKPLPKRKNIVISRNPDALAGDAVDVYRDVHEVIKRARSGALPLETDLLWIVGGEQIYRETISAWDEVYLTRIDKTYGGDTFFPEFEENFEVESRRRSGDLLFEHWVRKK